MVLREDFANATPNVDTHPDAHNETNDVVNNLQDALGIIFTALGDTAVKVGTDPGGAYANIEERLNVADFNRAFAGVGYVAHGGDANKARPNAGYAIYIWIGTVQPNFWTNNDFWVDTGV